MNHSGCKRCSTLNRIVPANSWIRPQAHPIANEVLDHIRTIIFPYRRFHSPYRKSQLPHREADWIRRHPDGICDKPHLPRRNSH